MRQLFLQSHMVLNMRTELMTYSLQMFWKNSYHEMEGKYGWLELLGTCISFILFTFKKQSFVLFSQSNSDVPPHRLRWPCEQLLHLFLHCSEITFFKHAPVRQDSCSSKASRTQNNHLAQSREKAGFPLNTSQGYDRSLASSQDLTGRGRGLPTPSLLPENGSKYCLYLPLFSPSISGRGKVSLLN